MAKHLSDDEIDKVIKGKTTKLAFLLKFREWMTCKECHAEAYIRFYEYLTKNPEVQIALDMADVPAIVAAPMVAPNPINLAPVNPLANLMDAPAPIFVPEVQIVAGPAPIPVPVPQPIEVAVDEPDEEEDEVHDDGGADEADDQIDPPDQNPNE